MRWEKTARQKAETCAVGVAWSINDGCRGGIRAEPDNVRGVVELIEACDLSTVKTDEFTSGCLLRICGVSPNTWKFSKEMRG
jgi:hypothetical protein